MPDYHHNGLGLDGKAEQLGTAPDLRARGREPIRYQGQGQESRIQPRSHATRRRAGVIGALLAIASLNLAACSPGPARYAGNLYDVESFAGGVIADEPRAALVGRDIIAGGGNAADAMVAMYFALAVTMPSSASIGGGGVCIAHQVDKKKKKITNNVIDFLPRAATAGQVAVPGNVRGMAALWAGFGKLPWAQLVSPGETLASQGTPISRTLANDIAVGGQVLQGDPRLAAMFLGPDGKPTNQGDNLRQSDLAAVLGEIRARGAGAFYAGPLAQRIADGAQAVGAPLTLDDLRNFKAAMTAPLEVPFGNQTVYLPQPPAASGISIAQLLNILQSSGDAGITPTFLADATLRVMADRSNWMRQGGDSMSPVADLVSSNHTDQLMANYQNGQASHAGNLTPPAQEKPENPWAVSALVVDQEGGAVACSFTMNALFGAGRIAGDTGILLAPAPNAQGAGFSALAPVIVANQHNGDLYFAATANGGMAGALSEAVILYNTMSGKVTLDQALQAPRVFHNGMPDKVFYEASGDGVVLKSAGYDVEQRQPLSIVNAMICPKGAPSNIAQCFMRNDYRGNGLASLFSSH
ncbi:MAG TPA: gamma-glutamyltransferase [Dongiaceae bacterium]|nr:gamma-glutamyltransferase [Dongiaceae bacterium]